MRIVLVALLLLALTPVALAGPAPDACSDLVPPGSPDYCGGQWACVSALGVSRCQRDLCWNTATCY